MRARARRAALVIAAAVLIPLSPTPAAAAGTEPVDVRFTTSPDPSAVGEEVVLTAYVTPRSASAKPTGTVTFNDGPAPLGSAPIDDDGVAALTVVFPAPGNHDLTAAYAGDDTYAPATTPSTHTVDVAVQRKHWVPGASGLWSTPGNWEPIGPPVDGDTVVLGSGPDGAGDSTLDIPDLSLAHISVVGAGHRVRPSANAGALTLTGSVHDDSSGGGIVVPPITLSSDPTGGHVVDGRVWLAGRVAGDGGITKTGVGELVLSGDNVYGGTTTIENGVATARHPAALGAVGNGTSVAEGASLRLEAGGAEPLTLHGAIHVTGVHSGAIDLQSEEVVVASDGAARLAGVVSGPALLRKTGVGSLAMGGPSTFHENTYEGGSIVATGTLQADAFAGALGTGGVTVHGGAVLDLIQSLPVRNDVRLHANSVLSSSGGGALRGDLVLDGPVTVRVPAWQGLSIRGVVSGTGPIRKEGSGPLWFFGDHANTMSGAVSVAEGTLLLFNTAGDVSVPEGVVVEKAGALTVFSDDQIGDTAPLIVHGVAAFAGTGDRFGSLTVTGHVGMHGHYHRHDGRKDFGIIHVDNLHLSSGGSFAVTAEPSLTPAVAGETHDAVRVGGSVSVGGTLYVRGHIPWGTTIKVIDNTGTAPVSGTFQGVPEGGMLSTALRPTYVSYKGGDGNDVTLTVPPARSGYWMLGTDGAVYPFGQAAHFGDGRGALNGGVAVDIEPTTSHNGYWILSSDGTVLPRGDAPALGSVAHRLQAGERATSISNTGWNAYWVFTDRGRALPVGRAGHFGDMAGQRLNGPVLGSVGTPSGTGYYMVASDGGIFAFGDADFRGSMGGVPLNGPVVGLSPDPDWTGYWLVASDGGIFAFEAPFRGSMGGHSLNRPVVGLVSYGNGYLMVGSDGGIFNFSSQPFHGSLGSNPPAHPITSVAPLNEL